MKTKKPARKIGRKTRAQRKVTMLESEYKAIMKRLQVGDQAISVGKPTRYKVSIGFTADRRLSRQEIDAIVNQIRLVVEEPSDDWAETAAEDHMGFTTRDVVVTANRIGKKRRK